MRVLILLLIALLLAGCAAEAPTQEQIQTEAPVQEASVIEEKAPEAPPEIEEKAPEPPKELFIPTKIEKSCFGFLIGAPEEALSVKKVGFGWIRPHLGPFIWGNIERKPGKYEFFETDEWVRSAQENDVTILGTIFPFADWDQEECHGAECKVSDREQFKEMTRSRCEPCDTEAYADFLTAMVERYDGDGVDDMPRLRIPIKYWEPMNEPEMDSPELSFYKEGPEKFVKLMKVSYEAIKSACPDCTVIQPGAAGNGEETSGFWSEVFRLDGDSYFDIANNHYISAGDMSTLNAAPFKELMDEYGVDKPIWITEAEFRDEGDVVKNTESTLAAGVEKIFYTTLQIGKRGPPEPGKYSAVYEKVSCK